MALSLEMNLYDYVFEKLKFIELHNVVLSLNKGVIEIHCLCENRIVNEVRDEVIKEGVSYDVNLKTNRIITMNGKGVHVLVY